MKLVEDQKGIQLVIPFLMFAAMFLTLYAVYYFFYSSSVNKIEYQMEEIELRTEMTKAAGQSVWVTEDIVFGDEVRIPVNDLKALRDEYGDDYDEEGEHPGVYLSTFFLWRETFNLFEITIDHDTDVHIDNQLTINIVIYENVNETMTGEHGASWQNFETPGYIHVGKTWFQTYALKKGDMTNILKYAVYVYTNYYPDIKTGFPNVEIYVSSIERARSNVTGIDRIWGGVALSWGTYAGTIGEISWIKSITDVLTVNIPGIPTVVRMILAAPLLLCLGYVSALFIKQVFFSL